MKTGNLTWLLAVAVTGVLSTGVYAGEARHHQSSGKKMNSMKTENKERKMTAQSTCPVTGEAIDKKVYTDYNGKRVYFCCGSCETAFRKDPEKYIRQLTDKGVTLEPVTTLVPQKTCPVMGNPIDRNLYVDYKGQRIHVCCGGCIEPLKKDPEKYLRKLEKMGEAPEIL